MRLTTSCVLLALLFSWELRGVAFTACASRVVLPFGVLCTGSQPAPHVWLYRDDRTAGGVPA